MARLTAEEEHTLGVETVIHLSELHPDSLNSSSEIYLHSKVNHILQLFSLVLRLQLSLYRAVRRCLGLDEL